MLHIFQLDSIVDFLEASGQLDPTNDPALYDLISPGYNYENEDLATLDAYFTSGTYTGKRFQSQQVHSVKAKLNQQKYTILLLKQVIV